MKTPATAPATMDVFWLNTKDISLPEHRLREVNSDAVATLAESIKAIGVRSPITVRPHPTEKRKFVVLTGAHRFEAVKSLNHISIPAIVRGGLSDRKAEMEEIAENLHRAELDTMQRSEQIDRWVKLLTEEEEAKALDAATAPPKKVLGKSSKAASKGKGKGGRGKKGGTSEAARALGLDRSEVQRAGKIAGIAKDAKKLLKDAGLADNQAALLEVSKAAAEEQKAKAEEVIAAKAAADAAAKASRKKPEGETPVEAHARVASKYIDTVYGKIFETYEAKKLVAADLERLVEALQSLINKAPKDRGRLVTKIAEAAAKPTAEAAE